VGTRLATAYDDPALGGVYKLAAVRRPGEKWRYRVKLSEQAVKTSTPGVLQVRRFSFGAELIADAIFDEERGWPTADYSIVDPLDMTRQKRIRSDADYTDLLVPVLRAGKSVYDSPQLSTIRERTLSQLALLPSGVKRFLNPYQYPVGLEPSLFELKTRLVLEARKARAT
jgi:nicotinate phosphoribosyltransferase